LQNNVNNSIIVVMNKYRRIREELDTLPKGHIYEKVIHGRPYNYLQYYDCGVLRSEYLEQTKLHMVRQDLSRRQELEDELSELERTERRLPSLSSRSRDLSGSLMLEDIEVAHFIEGRCVSLNKKLCPLFFHRSQDISAYLASRAIDRNRTNSRLLKKILNIHEDTDDMVALYSYGATVTDRYWFKTSGSKLKYQDISFTEDYYGDVALKGEVLYYPKTPKHSPQLTLIGSYEKCWRRFQDEWWLYKKGSEDEVFSELLCAQIAKAMKIPTAEYEYEDGFIKTKNFADVYFFEPMSSIAGDNDDYENVFAALDRISEKLAKQYLKLIFFDAVVNNVDRHNENCGVLRSADTGKVISLAPNFDNNLALISRSKKLNMDPSKDGFISIFLKFVRNNEKAKECYRKMKLPQLTEKKINSCLEKVVIKHPEIEISAYLMRRYNYLISKLQ